LGAEQRDSGPQPGWTLEVFAGTVSASLPSTRLLRKTVQRGSCVVVGGAAPQLPSCGGGGSLSEELSDAPTALPRKVVCSLVKGPPAFVAARPTEFRSATESPIVVR